jgi:hypothetical protein
MADGDAYPGAVVFGRSPRNTITGSTKLTARCQGLRGTLYRNGPARNDLGGQWFPTGSTATA